MSEKISGNVYRNGKNDYNEPWWYTGYRNIETVKTNVEISLKVKKSRLKTRIMRFSMNVTFIDRFVEHL